MATSRLLRAAKKFRKKLFALDEKTLKDIQRAYIAALAPTQNEINRLEVQIKGMIERGDPDTEIYKEIKDWYEKRILNIQDKINSFNKAAIEITKVNQSESVKVGNQYAVENINASLGKAPVNYNLNVATLDSDAMEKFVGYASDGSPLDDLFKKITIDYGVNTKEIVSNGILFGKNPIQIAREIRKETGMPFYRANTIARTESHRAARASTIENYKTNSGLTDGYIRLATADSRTCVVCYALHGTTYELNTIMPSHPNCRCIIVPKTKTWAELTGDPTIEDASDKIPTAEDLFNRLSERDKKRVLGPERYNKYKDGVSLNQMIGIKDNADWGPTTYVKPLRDL